MVVMRVDYIKRQWNEHEVLKKELTKQIAL